MSVKNIFIISILFFSLLDEISRDRSIFIAPVKIPLSLSANFGELRIDHFHSGLDIRTQGVTGKEVIATASGYVYRISVSSGGFGKALYLRHPSGYSTVYAHLDRFIPEIEAYVKASQYAKKSYIITLFPSKEKFRVDQGDLIAFSGNTGSSSGPHLHYEIRKSENEVPVNPLLFDFGIEDNIEPVMETLVVYPINRNTLINNQNEIRKIKVAGGHGNYYIPAGNEIRISGTAGFGIQAYDLLNNSYSKCSVHSIELIIDSVSVFKYVMDEFSFSETRYINSHIDYETFLREKRYIERAFILPNDKLSVYENVVKRGIFDFNGDRRYNIQIIVTDIHNNKSSLGFHIRSSDRIPEVQLKDADDGLVTMPYSRNNRFVTKNVSVNIPSGALYDTLFFSYKMTPGTTEMFSGIHHIHNRFTPVHRSYRLSIKPDRIPEGRESKLLIIQAGDDSEKSPLNSFWADGSVHAGPTTFGNFYIGIDTIPPVISANGLSPGVDLTGRKELRIRISDDLSGIKSYEPVIDGKWALFEYDLKNNILIYKFDSKRIAKGTKHHLTLKVTDNRDNISLLNCDFTW